MQVRHLYHGTTGDNILQIMRSGLIKPNSAGKIFFSERRFDSVLMHGADTKRKAAFAVKLSVTIPATAGHQATVTPGVADTLIITTAAPLKAQVLELYVREPRASAVQTVKGIPGITKFLTK